MRLSDGIFVCVHERVSTFMPISGTAVKTCLPTSSPQVPTSERKWRLASWEYVFCFGHESAIPASKSRLPGQKSCMVRN